jgi:quercetin dioxygenase-like cupin family protein
MYARELLIPQGAVIVGKMHAKENLFLLAKGDMTVWTDQGVRRVQAPFMVVTKPGDKRVGYAHEDSITINFHANPDDEQDLTLLEARYIMPEALEAPAEMEKIA